MNTVWYPYVSKNGCQKCVTYRLHGVKMCLPSTIKSINGRYHNWSVLHFVNFIQEFWSFLLMWINFFRHPSQFYAPVRGASCAYATDEITSTLICIRISVYLFIRLAFFNRTGQNVDVSRSFFHPKDKEYKHMLKLKSIFWLLIFTFKR